MGRTLTSGSCPGCPLSTRSEFLTKQRNEKSADASGVKTHRQTCSHQTTELHHQRVNIPLWDVTRHQTWLCLEGFYCACKWSQVSKTTMTYDSIFWYWCSNAVIRFRVLGSENTRRPTFDMGVSSRILMNLRVVPNLEVKVDLWPYVLVWPLLGWEFSNCQEKPKFDGGVLRDPDEPASSPEALGQSWPLTLCSCMSLWVLGCFEHKLNKNKQEFASEMYIQDNSEKLDETPNVLIQNGMNHFIVTYGKCKFFWETVYNFSGKWDEIG